MSAETTRGLPKRSRCPSFATEGGVVIDCVLPLGHKGSHDPGDMDGVRAFSGLTYTLTSGGRGAICQACRERLPNANESLYEHAATCPAKALDLRPLIPFGLAENGNLTCSACGFAEIDVPPGYQRLLAFLVRIAENHNREAHPQPTSAETPATCRHCGDAPEDHIAALCRLRQLETAAVAGPCCWRCTPAYPFMLLCPRCGNKRCPRANDHDNACTGSNELGQPGSAYA